MRVTISVFPDSSGTVRVLTDLKEIGTDTQMTLFCEQDILDVFHTPLPISRIIPFERKVLSVSASILWKQNRFK